MPSPFPGVDPYIEGQEWEDFHFRLINVVADTVGAALRPNYYARVEKRIYLEHPEGRAAQQIRPDLTVGRPDAHSTISRGAGTATIQPPFEIPQLMPVERLEPFLEVRLLDGHQLVAVVEVLSPSNKRAGGDGRREYMSKREAVMRSSAHFVELDLLRGGERMPMAMPLPALDFYALVSRVRRRPVAEVWPFTLRDPLPTIPLPLAGADPDLPLDLQAAFTAVYERAGYDYSLDYSRGTMPPLGAEDGEWSGRLLEQRF